MSRYKTRKINGVTKSAHRVIWEKAHGPIPKGHEVHHIDGNGNNNSLDNLILLTTSEHKHLHGKLRSEGKDVVDPNDPNVIAARLKMKRYRENNRERISAKQREYYHEHKEERLEYSRKYRAEHVEERRAYCKKYREEHLDAIMAYNAAHRDQAQAWRDAHRAEAREYRQKNKETIRRMHAIYRENNREIVNALWNLNRARKLGFPPEKIAMYEERLRAAKAAKGKL